MKTTHTTITVRELVNNVQSVDENGNKTPYKEAQNPDEFGVYALDGRLECRPSYQREYVWGVPMQRDFIFSVLKGWSTHDIVVAIKKDDNGNITDMELVDGQQRIITICRFWANLLRVDFNGKAILFDSMVDGCVEKKKFLDYEFQVTMNEYDSVEEKKEHFQAMNKPQTILTVQELRNAAYCGTFVEALKQKFGREHCETAKFSDDYLKYVKTKNDTIIRQELVELAIEWYLVQIDNELYNKLTKVKDHDFNFIKEDMDSRICAYMGQHMYDTNCNEVWYNFIEINKWIRKTFREFTCKEMKNVKNWAYLYRKYKDVKFDDSIAIEVKKMMKDPDIHHKFNIPEYLMRVATEKFTADELDRLYVSLLSVPHFNEEIRERVALKQDYFCPDCNKLFDLETLEAHHIKARSLGGRNEIENCVMLCKDCHGKRHNMSWVKI